MPGRTGTEGSGEKGRGARHKEESVSPGMQVSSRIERLVNSWKDVLGVKVKMVDWGQIREGLLQRLHPRVVALPNFSCKSLWDSLLKHSAVGLTSRALSLQTRGGPWESAFY